MERIDVREATELSVWTTIAAAFAEIDRYAARCVSNGQLVDYLELLVVADEGHEMPRPGTN